MKTLENMTLERLAELIDRFPEQRVAVVGDFFLDKYLDVDPTLAELSLETGKTAHQVVAVRPSPGAAGTVVSNLSALGTGALDAVGLAGDDGEAFDLRKGLARLDCSTDHLHCDPHRMTPTYLKPRGKNDPGLAGEQERYDTKNRTPTSEATQEKIIASLDSLLGNVDAVIIQDQADEAECGVVTTGLRQALSERARRWPNVVFWADSRRRICRFQSVIIKPNQFEAVGEEKPMPDDRIELDVLQEAVARLRRRTGAPIVATRGAEGMVVSDPQMTHVPGVRVSGPTDPTGAGDSSTAGAVLALAAGAELPEAALVGNLVASITVEQLATTGTAQPGALPARLAMWREQRT